MPQATQLLCVTYIALFNHDLRMGILGGDNLSSVACHRIVCDFLLPKPYGWVLDRAINLFDA